MTAGTAERRAGLPSLAHLRRLTDDTGLLQHAVHDVPDPHHGYTLDDNARGLALAIGLAHAGSAGSDLAERYLQFVLGARSPEQPGRFHNVMAYDRRWLDEVGSEESHGRAVAALAYTVARGFDGGMRDAAAALVAPALTRVPSLYHPRALAQSLIGLCWLEAAVGGHAEDIDGIGRRLAGCQAEHRGPGWEWFEPVLTYDNARLPLAMLLAAAARGSEEFAGVARTTLDFLLAELTCDGRLDVVGNAGWYPRGGTRPAFDQQPVDAAAMVEVCVAAEAVLGGAAYRAAAETAAAWFSGRNRLGVPLFDPATGACFDGLAADGVNRNRGAESTVAGLQARLALADPGWVVPGWTRRG